MNILFVVPYVPSLVRVRPYNLIRFLTARGHQVTVLTLWTNAEERAEAEALRAHCQRVVAWPMPRWRSFANCLLALPQRLPLQAVYSWHEPLVASVLAEGAAYDVIHVEHLRGARYGLYLQAQLARRAQPTPVVWDSVDSISLLFRQAAARSKRLTSRLLTAFELGRTEWFEQQLLLHFRDALVTAPADRDALNALLPPGAKAAKIHLLPNGVNLHYFKPNLDVTREPQTLVVSGKMSYHANVTMTLELAQQVMPRLWATHPQARLCIVGKDPTPAIQDLARQPGITVTGTVSDIRPYLQKATLAVAPIAYGVGIQNKVLEAMACGTPVVCSRQAISALQAEPGRELAVADGPEAFAAEVARLLDDPTERERLGRAGQQYVETRHDWQTIAAQVEQIYQSARERAVE